MARAMKSKICILTDRAVRYDTIREVHLAHLLAENDFAIDIFGPWFEGLSEVEQISHAIRIKRIRTVTSAGKRGKGRIPERILGGLFLVEFALKVLLSISPDCEIIIACNPVPFLVAWLYSRVPRRRRLVYYSREFIQQSEERRSIVKKLETVLGHQADLVVVPERNRGELIMNELGLANAPMIVLNCPLLEPQHCSDLLKSVFAVDDTAIEHVVIYQGALGPATCVKEMIEALSLWDRSIALAIFGHGEAAFGQELRTVAQRLGVEGRLHWGGRVSNEELKNYTGSADLGLVFYQDMNLNTKYCAPNKLFEYMREGLPVVGSENPLLKEVIEGEGIGLCVPPEPSAIAGAVNKILLDPDLKMKMGQRSRRAFLTKYNYNAQASPLVEWCLKVTHESGSITVAKQ